MSSWVGLWGCGGESRGSQGDSGADAGEGGTLGGSAGAALRGGAGPLGGAAPTGGTTSRGGIGGDLGGTAGDAGAGGTTAGNSGAGGEFFGGAAGAGIAGSGVAGLGAGGGGGAAGFGGMGGCCMAGNGGVAGSGGAAGSGGLAGSGGSVTHVGVCGERGFGAVRPTSLFDVEIAYYVLDASDQHMCLIRFDASVLDVGPSGCVDSDLEPCVWTYEFELVNPRVATDVNGACASSEAQYDAAWLMQMTGSRVALGFAEGDSKPVMKYRSGTPGAWEPYANGGYSSDLFAYDLRTACSY